jgi:hypothetical protein
MLEAVAEPLGRLLGQALAVLGALVVVALERLAQITQEMEQQTLAVEGAVWVYQMVRRLLVLAVQVL